MENQQQLRDSKGVAKASFVLGLLSFIPGFGIVSSILGISLGILGLNSSKRNLAKAGIVMCSILLVLNLFFVKSIAKYNCLSEAYQEYDRRWNSACESRNQKEDCRLPLYYSDRIEKLYKQDKDECYRW